MMDSHLRRRRQDDWLYSSVSVEEDDVNQSDSGFVGRKDIWDETRHSDFLDDVVAGGQLELEQSRYSDFFDEDASQLFKQFDCEVIQTPRFFDNFNRAADEMENALTNIANEVAVINKKGNEEKASGSAVSFTGSLLGIGGTVAAPFTFGTSLALTAFGAYISWQGSSISSKAEEQLTDKTNKRLQEYCHLKNEFNKYVLEWVPISQLLSEIIEELQDVFSDLATSFGHLLRSLDNDRYEDTSHYKVECILKCCSNFYGVARTSTHVVRNIEKIMKLTVRVKCFRQVLKASKNAGEVAKAMKGIALRVAIGRPQVSLTASKQVVASGRQIVSTIQKTGQISQTAKISKVASDGAGKVIKTRTSINASLKTITKETTTVTKSVCKVGLALGVIFAAIDLYEFDKAVEASKATCEAEKDLRSCIKGIKESRKEIMDQETTCKQLMKIKKFFDYLLDIDAKFVFDGVAMPLERVRFCLSKIKILEVTLNGD